MVHIISLCKSAHLYCFLLNLHQFTRRQCGSLIISLIKHDHTWKTTNLVLLKACTLTWAVHAALATKRPSHWCCQLSGNVNLITLIKHENLQRSSSKRPASLRAAFWKSTGEYNTFGCFPEGLQVNKSLLFISVTLNAWPTPDKDSAQSDCGLIFPS